MVILRVWTMLVLLLSMLLVLLLPVLLLLVLLLVLLTLQFLVLSNASVFALVFALPAVRVRLLRSHGDNSAPFLLKWQPRRLSAVEGFRRPSSISRNCREYQQKSIRRRLFVGREIICSSSGTGDDVSERENTRSSLFERQMRTAKVSIRRQGGVVTPKARNLVSI